MAFKIMFYNESENYWARSYPLFEDDSPLNSKEEAEAKIRSFFSSIIDPSVYNEKRKSYFIEEM